MNSILPDMFELGSPSIDVLCAMCNATRDHLEVLCGRGAGFDFKQGCTCYKAES